MELKTTSPCNSYEDEDGFIDMDITSTTSPMFRYSAGSREFEFQMGNVKEEKEYTTCCPADDLFYKGKLLPLHFPPRLQMREKLLQNSDSIISLDGSNGGFIFEQLSNPLFGSATTPCTNSNTPMESCNISPSDSCRASTEWNPDEYFFDWSTDICSLIPRDSHTHRLHHECHENCHHHALHPKKSWSRKIKHSSLGMKLKASRAYVKSLFNKSVCSNEACRNSTCNGDQESQGGCVLKAKECVNKYIKVIKKKPFGSLHHENFNISSLLNKNSKEILGDSGPTRKSFSDAINWKNAPTKKSSSTSNTSGSSSSSSSSSSSLAFSFNEFYELQLLKRSSGANPDVDSSVEGAIAHCKQSQKQTHPSMEKNTVAENKHFAGV